MTDDEKFFAWLDGELYGADAKAMADKVAADPGLTALAEQHRKFAGDLKRVFEPVGEAPIPDRFQALLEKPSNVIDLGAARRARSLSTVPQWAAIAATLAVGILVGTMVAPQGSAPVAIKDGKVYAASAVDHALNVQLASAPAGDVRIGLTFRDQGGEICRSFSTDAASGLACRDVRGWRLRGLFAAPEGQGSAYRMAAGMDPNLAALVDSSLSGEPFDATAEKAAKDKGWR